MAKPNILVPKFDTAKKVDYSQLINFENPIEYSKAVLFDYCEIPLVITETQFPFKIIKVNPAFCNLLEYKSKDLVGEPIKQKIRVAKYEDEKIINKTKTSKLFIHNFVIHEIPNSDHSIGITISHIPIEWNR